jgi:hypothetical protein
MQAAAPQVVEPVRAEHGPPGARVVEDLEATRRALRRYRLASGSVRLALAELVLAALIAGADWMWVLPTAARAAGLAVLAVVAAVLIVRGIVLPGRRTRRQEAAVAVESGFPELGQRVRTTLEYAEPSPITAPAAPDPARIADAVAAYARAIESRDLGALRQAYPGLTAAQERNFAQFFDATRALKASLAVASADVTGATAEVRVAGSYEFVTGAGKTERQPVSFHASLRHDGTRWRLTSVR